MTTTTAYDFDTLVERRGTGNLKWELYGDGVLPLWVADMDFPSPEPILQALRQRVDHGFFGYQFDSLQLRDILVARMAIRYGWQIKPQDIHFAPTLVSATNAACRAYAEPGEAVLIQTPAYPPFLSAPKNSGRDMITVDLAQTRDGQLMRYEIDFDAFEAAITPHTKLFLLCNPHNPVGRAYQRWELERLAEICLRHDLIICADEIHCDLMLDGGQHITFVSLAPEIAERTITLMSPTKTFNIPTLQLGFAIAQDETLLKRFKAASEGIVPHPGAMGFTAAIMAYTECQSWLNALLPYLQANRDYLAQYIQEHFPGVSITRPEATYLAWLDWRNAKIDGSPFKFFLEKAKVAFGDGAVFGQGHEGFVRLNFASPRQMLTEALERVRAAMESL